LVATEFCLLGLWKSAKNTFEFERDDVTKWQTDNKHNGFREKDKFIHINLV